MIFNLLRGGQRKLIGQNSGILARYFSGKNEELYERLGVTKTADEKEIKKAYKKATLKHHPDKGGDPNEFKKVQ